MDLSIFRKLSNFYESFLKKTTVDFKDAHNFENTMTRWELKKKNYQKYLELFGDIR